MTSLATSSGCRVLVLGPVAVVTGGVIQALPGQQGQVLSLLAASYPNPVTTDALVDELWLDRPPKSARTGLRVVIARLRERFGKADGSVIYEGGSYSLTLEPDQLDWIIFDRAVASAEERLAETPEAAADQLVAALDLWRGDPFQPLGSSAALAVHAAHLDERRREAEELLLAALLAAGRADSASTWATQFVETEPYRERRWEQLMLALYRTGRQAEALRAARRAATILRDDLGIDVGPRLRQLETDILDQAPHLDGPDQRVKDLTVEQFLAVLHDRTARIPSRDDSFVGRSADEARLAALTERSRLVTIVGPPGVGKTRLAAQYASAAVDRNVIWLDLVPLTPATIVAELAAQLGVRVADRPGSEAIADALDRDRVLLVLDNCEHLVSSAAGLAEALLAACPQLMIIATSRAPLASPSESQLAIGPLAVDDSLRLLADRSPNGLEAVSSRSELELLVEQLDGVPLSIELAAPYLGATSSRHLGDQLAQSLAVATGHGRHDPRHRSLDHALDWSLDLLAPADRSLYASLGVMDGSFTVADVAELASAEESEVSDGLSRLVAGGLVQSAPMADGRSGWRQLNSIRTHARSKLRADGLLAGLERTQAELQVKLVRLSAIDLIGPDEDIAVRRLQRASNQLRAAHRWLLEAGAVEASATFSLGMWEYSFFRQDYSHYGWLDDTLALDGADELGNADELLAQAALAAWARDRFALSSSLADRSEEMAAALGHRVPLAAQKARFNVAVHENRLDDAFTFLARLLSESIAQASTRHHSDNLVVLAMGYAQLGSQSEAESASSESLALANATGNPTSISWARVGVGSAQLLSDPREAARSFSAAGRLAWTVRNHWVRGMALAGLVTALRRQGRTEQARRLLAELVELWGRANAIGQQWRSCQEAILLLADGGEHVAAARLLGRLDLADHVPPMPPDDADRLEAVAEDLRRLGVDAAVDAGADDSVGLAYLVSTQLRRRS